MSEHHKSCKWKNYITMEFLPCPFCRIEELTEHNSQLWAENYDIKEYLQQVDNKYKDMEKDGTDDCCAFCVPASKLKYRVTELEEEKQRAWEPREEIEVKKIRQQTARECAEIAALELIPWETYYHGLTGEYISEVIKEKFNIQQ